MSKRNVLRAACAAAAAAFLLACGTGTTPDGDGTTPQPSGPTTVVAPQGSPAASTKPTPASTLVTFGDGVWRVPQEVKPGTYRTIVPADSWNCYHAVLRNFDSKLDSIIDNGNQEPGLPQIMTIPKTAQGVEASGCGIWVKIK